MHLSVEIVQRKEKVLRALIDASEDLYLTYPYFDLASLDDKNVTVSYEGSINKEEIVKNIVDAGYEVK